VLARVPSLRSMPSRASSPSCPRPPRKSLERRGAVVETRCLGGWLADTRRSWIGVQLPECCLAASLFACVARFVVQRPRRLCWSCCWRLVGKHYQNISHDLRCMRHGLGGIRTPTLLNDDVADICTNIANKTSFSECSFRPGPSHVDVLATVCYD
jgi:hypothetical protein